MPTTIFNISSTDSHAPKIHVSHSAISSAYLDPAQPPLKKLPFRQIRSVPFIHDVSLCMPTRVYDTLYSNGSFNRSRAGVLSMSTPERASRGREVAYAKVIMTLSDILGDYDLRTGNYLMLAGPVSPGANDVAMSLNSGTLNLTVPQTIYQRSGLTFPTTKLASGGRKHERSSMRYRFDIDLRAPSMVKGRNGFDRLVHAARNVDGLREGRLWLFGDLDGYAAGKGKKRKRDGDEKRNRGGSGASIPVSTSKTRTTAAGSTPSNQTHPLTAHHPTLVTDPGVVTIQHDVLVPSIASNPVYLASLDHQTTISRAKTMKAKLPTVLEEDIHELAEYLGLLSVGSPRITQQGYGKLDPYLCRYTLPSAPTPVTPQPQEAEMDVDNEQAQEGDVRNRAVDEGSVEQHTVEDIISIQYSGFMPPDFVMQLVIDMIRQSRAIASDADSRPGHSQEDRDHAHNAWIAVNVRAHQTEAKGGVDGYMILLQSSLGTAGGDAVAARSPEDTDAVDFGVSVREPGQRGTDTGSESKEEHKSGKEARGFRYVTCFEFVDSMTR